jgi:hypothetical protein
VGVVPQDDAGRGAEQLHPARNLGRRGEPRGHLHDGHAESERARAGGERVRHVEVAEQRQRDVALAEASLQTETAARGIEDDLGGADVGCRVQSERHPAGACRQPLPGHVIEVHHLHPGLDQHAAELELGGEVRFHRSVIIQMIAREVGEYSGGEAQPVQTPLLQAV